MLKNDPSSTGYFILGVKTVFFHVMDTVQLVLHPAHHSCVAVVDAVWSAQPTTPTTNPHSFPTLSPWLLVLQCLLLSDEEFMLWPLFTGKNVPTCVWADMPFVWVKNVCYFCWGCLVCHLHAMLHRGFCCKLFALGDADTFNDLLSILAFHPHKASVSHPQKRGFLKMLSKVDTFDSANPA